MQDVFNRGTIPKKRERARRKIDFIIWEERSVQLPALAEKTRISVSLSRIPEDAINTRPEAKTGSLDAQYAKYSQKLKVHVFKAQKVNSSSV